MSKKDKEIDMLQMVEKHKKDLDYVKKEGTKLKKLSPRFMPKTYKDVLVFCLNIAEYCGEEDDIKFLKSLPQTEEEFQKLGITVKKKMLDLGKKQQNYFKTINEDNKDQIKALDATKDSIINRLLNKLQVELDAYRQELSKKDYETMWECALDIRKMICDGFFGTPTKDVAIIDCYRWGLENCTVRGEPIEDETDLVDGYDNAKRKKKSRYIIGRFEEDYYD